jgi:hypothetical protein
MLKISLTKQGLTPKNENLNQKFFIFYKSRFTYPGTHCMTGLEKLKSKQYEHI